MFCSFICARDIMSFVVFILMVCSNVINCCWLVSIACTFSIHFSSFFLPSLDFIILNVSHFQLVLLECFFCWSNQTSNGIFSQRKQKNYLLRKQTRFSFVVFFLLKFSFGYFQSIDLSFLFICWIQCSKLFPTERITRSIFGFELSSTGSNFKVRGKSKSKRVTLDEKIDFSCGDRWCNDAVVNVLQGQTQLRE